MTFNFKQYRIHQNIKPINLPNSEIFLHDLVNIENGLTGRSDLLNFGNTFINEAVQLLVNSIALFEMGYFDSAYYSLRQAIELSTTLVFLSDIPSEEREQKFEAWKVREHFPLYRDMMQKLSRDGLVFSDMQIKLESFFAHVKSFSNVLNKYVHKQGYRNFYVSRNHPMNKQSSDIFIKNFEQHLEKTIGIVAVMRLAIDPFPVLLMDEEIMYRYFDSLTEPYSFDFVNKYIGEETLNFYKMTDLYKQTYESIIVEEKKCESVYEIMKYNLIDTTKADEIIPQLHLLSRKAIICTLITLSNKKVLSVTDEFRFPIYVSDRQKYRTSITWSFELVNEFSKVDIIFNKEYNSVYISRFDYDGIYYIEHSEPFDSEDISYMSGLVLGAIFSMNENTEDK